MLARLRHRDALDCSCCVTDAKAVRIPTGDPTGTAPIRQRYKTLLDIRWRRVIGLLRETILKQDMLGLRPDQPTSLGLALSGLPADAKQRAFQTWVDATLNRIILAREADYLDPMIEKSYAMGVIRSQKLQGVKVTPPNAREVVHNLQQLVVTELQGVCEAVSQRVVRLGALAQVDGTLPLAVFAEMRMAVEQIGITRSRQMVAVMVVKAHGTGTLDLLESIGIKRVGVVPETVRPVRVVRASDARGLGSRLSREEAPSRSTIGRLRRAEREVEEAFGGEDVEVLTAGDDQVCPECEDISADGPYSIDEARVLIPAHPECRCTFVSEDQFRELEGG